MRKSGGLGGNLGGFALKCIILIPTFPSNLFFFLAVGPSGLVRAKRGGCVGVPQVYAHAHPLLLSLLGPLYAGTAERTRAQKGISVWK
jgi:hypothetical protein